MARTMRSAAVALALAGVARAQSSSVISVFFPDADPQILYGSLIASDASKTTIAFGCPSGVDSSDCGFGTGQVTGTFGSATFAATGVVESLTVTVECAVSGTTAASCVQTYVGPIGFFDVDTATDDSLTATDISFNTQITTSATTTILAQTDIAFIPITLTAFANAVASTTTGTGASGSASQDTTATASSTSSATASTHSGDATSTSGPQLRWIVGFAGLLGWTFSML